MYMGYLSLLSIPDGAVDTAPFGPKTSLSGAANRGDDCPGHDPDAWPKFQKSPQYYEQGHLACNRACRRIGVGCGRTVSVYSAPDLRASNIEKHPKPSSRTQ